MSETRTTYPQHELIRWLQDIASRQRTGNIPFSFSCHLTSYLNIHICAHVFEVNTDSKKMPSRLPETTAVVLSAYLMGLPIPCVCLCRPSQTILVSEDSLCAGGNDDVSIWPQHSNDRRCKCTKLRYQMVEASGAVYAACSGARA